MLNFIWSESLSVGNPVIDEHHQRLINLFNEVGHLVESEQKTPLFSTIKVISELNVYAIFHFKEEERLMELSNYPELDSHKRLHVEFIDNMTKFKDEYLHSDPLVNYELFDFLSKWILEHIMNEDQKYSEYI